MSQSLSPEEPTTPEEPITPEESATSEFTAVAAVGDIPDGKGRAVKFGGKDIAVFRIGEEFYAISNVCPHYGAQLCEGFVRNEAVMCPWHGWQFDLKTGKGLTNPGQSVATYAVKVEDGQIKLAAL